MDSTFDTDRMIYVMGNHDYWYGFGLPDAQTSEMSNEEVEHQIWTHQQIGQQHRRPVRSWKFVQEKKFSNGKKASFQHYGLNDKTNWFKEFVRVPTIEKMNTLFSGVTSEIIFYGHHHEESDIS